MNDKQSANNQKLFPMFRMTASFVIRANVFSHIMLKLSSHPVMNDVLNRDVGRKFSILLIPVYCYMIQEPINLFTATAAYNNLFTVGTAAN